MNRSENKSDKLSCFKGNVTESVPTFLFDTSLCSAVTGISMAEIFRNDSYDPVLAAKAVAGSRRYLGHDMAVGALKSNDYRVFGAKMKYTDNAPMMTVKKAFGDPMNLYRHEPGEIDCPSIHAYARGFKEIRKLDSEILLAGSSPAPFSVCCMLRGLEPMLIDTLTEKDYVKDLLRFAQDVCSTVEGIIFSEGEPDFGVITGAFDNPEIMSLEQIRELCLPGVERQLRSMKSYGVPTVYHPHGQFTVRPGMDLLDDYRRMDIDCLYYGENNPHHEIRQLCQHDFSLMGGIDTFTTIYLGDSERVVHDTENILKAMQGAPYVFTCSCSVDGDLDIEKMRLMIDTVRRFSGRREISDASSHQLATESGLS